MELRKYQNDIIKKLKQSIKQGHRRIIIQLHVGGGKTVISAEILRTATEKLNKSLFIAPRRQLVYQASNTFHAHGVNNGIIMAKESRFMQPLVQVASIDTLTARVGSGKMKLPDAKIVIWDECHNGLTKKRMDLLKDYPLVIGITATPAQANGKGLGFFYTDIVEGLTMSEMVNQGYLVPMKYYGAEHADLSKVKLNADGDYIESQLADAVDTPELIGCVYSNYKRIAGDRTTLIFAVNRAHARHIHNEFIDHGVSSEYIDGETETDEREAIRKRVESGETKVIVNIGVMAFGTDWPRISCIIIARPTKNICSWIQMIGRGSRLFHEKSDCLVIYHGDNFQELGMIDDPIEWSLDDKTTIKDRKQAKQKEKKEPKEIVCSKCKYVFKSRKSCPKCGAEMVAKGESIPFYEAELKEIIKPKDRADFYAELLGYCMKNKKTEKYALAVYKSKIGAWPKERPKPKEPSQETLGYIKHTQIRWSHAKKGRHAVSESGRGEKNIGQQMAS
jgi:DNA repair protein RadD